MAIALVLGVTGCNDSNNDNQRLTFMDFMTLTSSGSTGCVLEMYNPKTMSAVTLTSTSDLSNVKGLNVGDRVLVLYGFPEGREYGTSGPIDLYGLRLVTNGMVQWGTDVAAIEAAQMQTQSAYITGIYLNYQGTGLFGQEPKNFRLVADEATRDSEMPDVYLIIDPETGSAQTWQAAVASFDVSDIWTNPRYSGFKLHINDSNTNFRTLTFQRGTTPPRPNL